MFRLALSIALKEGAGATFVRFAIAEPTLAELQDRD